MLLLGSSLSLSSSGTSAGPGQAVVADGPLVCCVMRRADFERLLGPYEELWRYEALRKVSSRLIPQFDTARRGLASGICGNDLKLA